MEPITDPTKPSWETLSPGDPADDDVLSRISENIEQRHALLSKQAQWEAGRQRADLQRERFSDTLQSQKIKLHESTRALEDAKSERVHALRRPCPVTAPSLGASQGRLSPIGVVDRQPVAGRCSTGPPYFGSCERARAWINTGSS